jgi:hypothetical protein
LYPNTTDEMPIVCTADCENAFNTCGNQSIANAPWNPSNSSQSLIDLFGTAENFCSQVSTPTGTCLSTTGIVNLDTYVPQKSTWKFSLTPATNFQNGKCLACTFTFSQAVLDRSGL